MLSVVITILLKCVKLHIHILVLNKFTRIVRISFPVNFTMKKNAQSVTIKFCDLQFWLPEFAS